MDDKFTKGFVSGVIASVPGTVVALIMHALKWLPVRWADFTSVLVLGHQYKNFGENCFATLITIIFIGTMGGLFPLILQVISTRNLLLQAGCTAY